MRQSVLKLLIAILVVGVSYFICDQVLPRVGLRTGWEAGNLVIGIIIIVGWIIAGTICFSIILKVGGALRHSPAQRHLGSYAMLVTSALITLIALASICLAVPAMFVPWL